MNTNKFNGVKNLTLAIIGGLVLAWSAHAATTSDTPQNGQTYHFTLIQGKGSAVCEAYLKRLNTADYTTPPYCDIPEATSVPGFTPLKRVPLTAEEIAVIAPRITQFDMRGEQGSKEQDAVYRAREIQRGATPVNTLRNVEDSLQHGMKVWRYDPPVDIDNDGKPDNVVVWPDLGCGHAEHNVNYETDGRKPIRAYVLATGNERLDISKTKAIFGHPSGGYPIHLYDGSPDPEFRPIGATIGIFKYEDLYYIDTYLNNYPLITWGFLTGGSTNETDRADTLAVFLRQHGKTRLVCEYHMTITE